MPKADRQAFAERVNALRQARGLSWKQLAAQVGSVAALRRWQRGHAWPRTETVVALSEALGVTTDYLLTGRAPMHLPCTEPRFLALKDAIEETPAREEGLMTQAKGKPRPHRPSFVQIERTLPEVGSREARLLRHVLQCELCTDAALSILEIGNRTPKRKAPDYDAAFAAAAAKATSIFEQRMRAMTLPDGETSATRSEARGSETA